jgi:anti-anti-sigma factor
METRIQKEKGTTIISVKGRMDAVSSPGFEKQLLELMDQGQKDFVIDLGELEYISSAGLRVILGTVKKLKEKEGRLFLCALKDIVREIFEISGFAAIVPTCDSVDSALSRMS